MSVSGRIRASDLSAALRQTRQSLSGEILLAATDETRSQWAFVFPSARGGKEILRRMVVQSGQPRRTVVQQMAGVYRDMLAGRDVITALDRAYDVEAVTKRFFERYAEIFGRVMNLVEDTPHEGWRRR